MTPEQCQIVRRTFEPLRGLGTATSLLFYKKLFELDPRARRLFHNDLLVQSKKLMDTLTTVVDSLDRFDALQPRLRELGRLHAAYGVRLEQYDTVQTALLWALGQSLGADFDKEAREAWASALAAISKTMKEGANVL